MSRLQLYRLQLLRPRYHFPSRWLTLNAAGRGAERHHFSTSRTHPDNHTSTSNKVADPVLPVEESEHANWKGFKIYAGSAHKAVEPWIHLDSLSSSLDAHRAANREGSARDGILIPPNKRRRQNSYQPDLPQRSQTSTKTVHIAPAFLNKARTAYGGICPGLLSEWQPAPTLTPRLRLPWLSRLDRKASGQTPEQRLSSEIEACKDYFLPSPTEKLAVGRVYDELKAIICHGLKSSAFTVEVIGSRATGTESPTSDLDINVRRAGPRESGDPAELTSIQLCELDNHMRDKRWRDAVLIHAYLGKARVPIVTGTHIASGLEFQLQSSVHAYDSLEIAKSFVAEYPTACVLFKVIKQMLLMRGLTTGSLGGITSYPLLNMIVASMKFADTRAATGTISSQFLNFLDFWSEFDFDKHRIVFTRNTTSTHLNSAIDPISARPRIVPKGKDPSKSSSILSFEDPADSSNDLGSSTYGMRHIQALFIEARKSVRQQMCSWHAHSEEEESILSWCLGADYTSVEEARWQLCNYHKGNVRSEP